MAPPVIVASEAKADLATVAARGGADGVHVRRRSGKRARAARAAEIASAPSASAAIRTKDEAMSLGEAGADYLLFGEPRPDGSLPALESVVERAAWWAEIFETPCVAYAPSLEAVAGARRDAAPSSSRLAMRSGPIPRARRPP